MNGFEEKNGVLHAEDIPLPGIAESVGTPCYVYSSAVIENQYNSLTSALKKHLPADKQPLLCYACKANSNIAILRLLQSLGSSIEVVSGGELARALKAGFDPKKIVMEGVGKTREDITAGLNANVHQFNIESLGEMALINEIAGEMGKTANIVFRLNPDVGGGAYKKITTGSKENKFGISPQRVTEGYEQTKDMANINAIGLFTHIGSQISEAEPFTMLFAKLASFVNELREKGHEVSRLDIGGGFPIRYTDDESLLDLDAYAKAVNEHIVPLDAEIIMEPGRFLVGNAGILLTEVLYTKQSYDRNFLIVDAGMNDFLRPAIYDAWHAMEPVTNRDAQSKTYDVAGPVCESSDIFAKDRELPEMQQGDLLVLRSTGAYGFCMASNYNTRPLPAEVLVNGDQFAIISQRQTIEDILEKESIPDWLK